MNLPKLLVLLFTLCLTPAGFGQKDVKPLEPNAIVKNLYAAHKADQSPFFQTEDRKRLDPFFTNALAKLIWADAVEAKGEVGRLGFDPLYASQDPQITNFVIGNTGWGGDQKFGPDNEAVVQVTFKDSGKEVMISFQFLKGKDQQWRIDDIRYPSLEDVRLKGLLTPGKPAKKS